MLSQQPGPFGLMAGLHAIAVRAWHGLPRIGKIFTKRFAFWVEEFLLHHREKLLRPRHRLRVSDGFVHRQHRLESMHMRVLPPRLAWGNSFDEAAVARGEVAIDKVDGVVEIIPDLRVAADFRGPGQRQQDKHMIVRVAQRVGDRIVGRKDGHVSGLSVGRPIALDHECNAVHHETPTIDKPAKRRGMGIHIDLPRLHA